MRMPYIWCPRRGLNEIARKRATRRRLLCIKNQNPRCLLMLQLESSPTSKQKGQRMLSFLFWCGRRDLNPYGKTTRPSNVRVCQFRHFRVNSDIILQQTRFVNTYFQKNSKNLTVLKTVIFLLIKSRYFLLRHICGDKRFHVQNRSCGFVKRMGFKLEICGEPYPIAIL